MKGHGKGSAFERKVAKEIVKAYSRFGITQKDCWRSTLSGGHPRAAGDLEISERLNKIFPYCLEMKHRKKIRFEHFLLQKDSEERRWVRQTLEGAAKAEGTTPVLVMRANNCPIYALVQYPNGWVEVDSATWILLPWKEFLRMAIREIKRYPRYRRKHGRRK
jgi:hypothetical protein